MRKFVFLFGAVAAGALALAALAGGEGQMAVKIERKTCAAPDGVTLVYSVCGKGEPDFNAIIMKHMGHYPMLERPDEFNEHVAEVVAELVNPLRGIPRK